MKLEWSRTLLMVATALVAGTVAVGAAAATGSFERTLEITGPVDLDVTTGSGTIKIRAGEAGKLHVKGTIKARDSWRGDRDAEEKVRALEANPPVEQNGNVIRIGHIEDRELRRNVSISYDLVVPVETRVRSKTGSGHQTIEGIRGPVDADTGSGHLEISDIGAEVKADTGSGHIQLDSIAGGVHADSGSGDIRATGIAGPFAADTGSGSVKLEQTAPGDVSIDTGSGSVEVSGVRGALAVDTGSGSIAAEGEPTAEWNLEAGSGSITVRLPAEGAFDLYARTSSGSITTEHPLVVQGAVKRNQLQGKVRGGGFPVRLHTGSGNIRIE